MRAALAFGTYVGCSLLLFGRSVLTSPAETVVGDAGADKTLYMWSLVWWPSSLVRGRDPFETSLVWTPHGIELGLMHAGAGLAFAAAPLTATAGPVVAYNVLVLLAPSTAAMTAFLLSRRLCGSWPAALVGGYVYGFSSYELGHVVGHLPLSFVALVPLTAHLGVRRLADELPRRRFVVLLAAVFAAQFLVVAQILVGLLVVAALVLGSARLILRDPRITRVGLEALLAAVLAALAVSPFLLHALAAGPEYVPKRSPFSESADVLNLVVPTRLTWVRPPGSETIADRFTSSPAEQGAYVGLPFLALLALAVRSRTAARLTLGAAFTVAAVLALGPRVKVAGTVVGIAPWDAISRLPFLGSASPIRLSVFAALAAAVGVALALSDQPNWFRAALAAAGVIATLPNPGLELWASKAPQPMFFAHEVYRRHLEPDDVALVLPYGPSGWSMLWHAQADFGFQMVGGHFPLRVTPREEKWRDVYTALGRGRVAPCRLRSFLEAHAVDVVIVAPGTRSSARRAVAAAMRREPVHSQDVLVYARDGPISRERPRAAPPNCRA